MVMVFLTRKQSLANHIINHLLQPGVNPTDVADPGDANVTIGFDLAQAPYYIEIRGTFTLDSSDDVTSGNISSVKAFGYDGTTKGALAAKNESLSVNWADFAPFLVDDSAAHHDTSGGTTGGTGGTTDSTGGTTGSTAGTTEALVAQPAH